jgi:hypothetical protein
MKPATALLLGLIAGFAIAVNSFWQFNATTSVVPGWHTTIQPGNISVKFILANLALIVAGMAVARFIPFFKKYFTMERLEVMNTGLALAGLAVCLDFLWDVFVASFSGYVYEQMALNYRQYGSLWIAVTTAVLGVLSTQLHWAGKIRRNHWWTLAVAFAVLIGSWLEAFGTGAVRVTNWWN